MKITSGKYELFESGFLNSPSMEPIEFHLEDNLVLEIKVQKDEKTSNSTIDLILNGPTRLVITFTNPLTLNYGPQAPINLGSLRGRVFYAMLRVSVIGNYSSYQVGYSFYMGEQDESGEKK
jgi:hypothetical protein